jgi:hypothetical protein
MSEDGDEPDPDGDGESPGRLARIKTTLSEAVGVAADAALDAI